MQLNRKEIFGFLFLVFLNPLSIEASQIQICEIRFGEKNLDKKELRNTLRVENPWTKVCKQIGIEYDSQGNPEIEKPIYACCRETIGSEATSVEAQEVD